MNFGPLTMMVKVGLLAYPKSTLHVLRMLMHLGLGHVTLLGGKFQSPKFPPNRTYGSGWTHTGLCPKILGFYSISTSPVH